MNHDAAETPPGGPPPGHHHPYWPHLHLHHHSEHSSSHGADPSVPIKLLDNADPTHGAGQLPDVKDPAAKPSKQTKEPYERPEQPPPPQEHQVSPHHLQSRLEPGSHDILHRDEAPHLSLYLAVSRSRTVAQ